MISQFPMCHVYVNSYDDDSHDQLTKDMDDEIYKSRLNAAKSSIFVHSVM